jgi:tetratricopeptide (TPR) repeat protein
MTLTRMIPTVLLLAGVAAAQLTPPPPPAAPAPAPMPPPVAVPAPPLPPDDFLLDADDRLLDLKSRLLDMRDDFQFNFDFDAKIAMVQDRLGDMRLRFPMAAQIAPTPPPAPPAPAMPGMGRYRVLSDERAYESGQRALEGRRYGEALEYFNQVASRGKDRADGAWYWKAYTLLKLGRADEARAALAELRKSYPSSRWLDDAKALEVEAGKPVSPETESNEELKLIALNGLMQSDPDRALPLLDTLLKSAQPPRIKRNALFVLAQSNSPKGQQMLEQVARGQGNPDVQLLAIRYLGERRRQGGSNPVLAEIYASSNDPNVKRAILNAFENARDKDRLLQIAKTERDSDLRLQAIRLLASTKDAQAEVWSLYAAESNPEIKQHILESLPSSGSQEKLLEVARTEKDPKLRRFAILNLASTRAATTGDTLAGMYASEQDQNVRRAIIDALSSQKNVKAMVQIARAEKDPKMQQRILERLVSMKSPEANDYLMEVIKK